MDKWNLLIDIAQCENCNNCVLAAKDELVGNDFPGYSAPHPAQGTGVIRIERTTRGTTPMVDAAYVPRLCNHCDDAPCLKVGADGSVKKRADGIVLIDPDKARGRRDLVDACPYGAIVWNEAEQLPQSWFFDAHLLDAGWTAPRCVSVCPTQAITAVKLSDAAMVERARAEGLRPLKPELGTKPRVYYRNLHRADRCFIGGSVTARIEGRIECVTGVRVELFRGGIALAQTHSDTFGDFRFDGLEGGSGRHEIRMHHTTLGHAERAVELGHASVVIGDICVST
ncbi:4Fe-4S dicluster domain-containing protein [Sphaerotilus sp.]|uniref:4Fe-4S dicluster domain-containing protein n=1 Tax=Sphaerotilus sp. TaxID=2093942 RepID=UPI00286E80D2|nr:4Fe-4S dicluster domain-containing protein [Sphaerotilus sp.]